MAVALQTLLDRSTRNMGAVHEVVKESALEVIKRAYNEGIYVQISSGYRSNAEQQKLYNQGRSTPGSIVTNAKPGQSMHNYGLAVDYFLVSDDGKTALWTVNKDWRRVAQIAKSLGFEWGGDWTGFVDYPHLQMTGGLTLSQLQAGRRPKLTSKVPKQPEGVYWDGSKMNKGQIGRIKILKRINLWRRINACNVDDCEYCKDKEPKLVLERVLEPGETYRVYGYDGFYGGQYGVGSGLWITDMDGYVKYETPSKDKLQALRDFYK